MFYARVWAVVGILIICTDPTITQTSGTVQGVVVDAQGQPIDEAIISINNLQGADTAEAQTSTDGQFSYSGVIPGVYTITASKQVGLEIMKSLLKAFSIPSNSVQPVLNVILISRFHTQN